MRKRKMIFLQVLKKANQQYYYYLSSISFHDIIYINSLFIKLKGGKAHNNKLHGICYVISTSMFYKLCWSEKANMAKNIQY